MKRFSYRAKEQASGKVIKGSIQADNERAAGRLLLDRGYIPDLIKEEGKSFKDRLNRVSSRDRINFTRQFATLVGAGLPLSQALRTVSEQTASKAMKAVVDEILTDVESGRSLGDAFGKHKEIFNEVYLALIRAGEVSGTLDESLKRIAAQEEKDEKMMSKIRGAMTYPVIVLAVIVLVFMYMMLEVVPQVEGLYADLGEELPVFTQILVGMKDFFLSFWWATLVLMFVLVASLVQFSKTPLGVRSFANLKLNMPLFGKLFRTLYMARFTRVTQILMSTGTPVLDTLKIAGDATNNVIVEESIVKAAEKVKSGRKLSEALKDREYILHLVYQMAAIGEQSGKMDEMMGKTAQVYEDELEEKIQAISTMIEPILMVLLAVVAGGMVGGILFPIYALVNSIA